MPNKIQSNFEVQYNFIFEFQRDIIVDIFLNFTVQKYKFDHSSYIFLLILLFSVIFIYFHNSFPPKFKFEIVPDFKDELFLFYMLMLIGLNQDKYCHLIICLQMFCDWFLCCAAGLESVGQPESNTWKKQAFKGRYKTFYKILMNFLLTP